MKTKRAFFGGTKMGMLYFRKRKKDLKLRKVPTAGCIFVQGRYFTDSFFVSAFKDQYKRRV